MVRERESGTRTNEDLRALFKRLDADNSGWVDVHEYVLFSMRDALSRSADRVIDLLRRWDPDGNGLVTRREFGRALRELGFHSTLCTDADIDTLFRQFDVRRAPPARARAHARAPTAPS